ncbi:MAG: Na(+)-translocating NADH-quinone reductase subunit A [Deltaproteobacteria bacterium]|nr:Na(+)-translocating NADH-quinone reductase subunit A [Deltaproteobacteria bacterium]
MHRIRRGLDIPISGAPEQRVEDARPVTQVAVVAADHVGLRARMAVSEGEPVVRGQLLFEDRKNPGVRYTAPAAGTAAAINRGERRALLSVVIDIDEASEPTEIEYEAYTGKQPAELSADQIRALLVESGEWTGLRTRPFSRAPAIDSLPRSIFVTAIDTSPLAPDVDLAIDGREDLFHTGLEALVRLGDGAPVHLCRSAGSSVSADGVSGVLTHGFEGPHPAGNAGLHIHMIDPANRDRVAWHIGYQDVIAIGGLLETGKLHLERVIAIGGPAVRMPRLLRTRRGARVSELVAAELSTGERRVVAGSVLTGRDSGAPGLDYLGRFHNQISALSEARKRRFLGWLWPGSDRFSVSRLFLSKLLPGKTFAMDTDVQGGSRAMIPLGVYDGVMPFDMLPVFLFRALLSGDVDRAEELGCLELDEEDVALCSFVCPSKIDYGSALRRVLDQIVKEG